MCARRLRKWRSILIVPGEWPLLPACAGGPSRISIENLNKQPVQLQLTGCDGNESITRAGACSRVAIRSNKSPNKSDTTIRFFLAEILNVTPAWHRNTIGTSTFARFESLEIWRALSLGRSPG